MWWLRRLAATFAALGAIAACATFSASGGDTADAGADASDAQPSTVGPDASDASADAATDAGDCRGAQACQRVMFVTSGVYNPGSSLDGVATADKACNQLAGAPDASTTVKGRSYFAWLSDSTATPATRMDVVHGTAPYVRPDGATLAKDWKTLIGGSLDTAPSVDEQGMVGPGGGYMVWTGTDPAGELIAGGTCMDWKAPSATGFIGISASTTGAWTEDIGNDTCQASAHLYCIEK
jgi:hypothetical protein